MGEQRKLKKLRQPVHPLVVIFILMLLAAVATYLVPLGRYEPQELAYSTDAAPRENFYVDPETFRYVLDEEGEPATHPVPFLGLQENSDNGMMTFLFSGLSNIRQSAGTVGLIAYLLIIGGSFGVLRRTGVLDQLILAFSDRAESFSPLLPPALFIVSSLLGAMFGFREAAIPLAMLVVPLLIAMDFDAITGVLTTFVAMQVGMATSWMSPLALTTAQTIAEIPVFSGARLRLLLWVVLTLLGAAYTAAYAARVQDEPHRSAAQASDTRCRSRLESVRRRSEGFHPGSLLVLLILAAGLLWLLWGTLAAGYGLSEIASLFFVMALASGLVGAVFHLDDMHFSDIPRAFQAGAGELVGAVLVVGMAQGMVLLLGGISPTDATVLNTLLHWTQRALSEASGLVASLLMYVFHLGFNLVVPSDLGQAALTMPVMAPLADTLGISRQISVLASQLGGNLSHLLSPTSGCLIGVLAAARLEWGDWVRSQWRAVLAVLGIAAAGLVLAALIGYA